MHARSWLVLTAIGALACTSGCGSARWGSRHSRLVSRACVESSCDDPTCEICSPLPPLYDGMARSHRLNRRAMRGHGRHGHGRMNHGGCSCGQCGGEWFEGEIIDGEIIGGDYFGGCSSCGDGMVMDGGMPMEMSSACSTCQQHAMSDSSMPHSSMMPGQSFQMHGEQQPTLASPSQSSVPSGGPAAPPSSSSVPPDMAPAHPMGQPMNQPMGQPMAEPMTSMRTPNYGAALFGAPPTEPNHYVPASGTQPIMQEQASPMHDVGQPPSIPPAPPLASPAAHSAPMLMSPPSMPTFPGEAPGAPQPSDFYSPKSMPTQPNPIQLQSASIPAAPPAKKPMRPFSESAKPRQKPAGQPQWEGTLQMQTIQPADHSLPSLPTL
ncbi:hypothetical protein Pan44_08470 [Caulifigura coniformis]|uniref:Uncharacterized protein n=1 Tax=Caulifigura coniformis TaxID=2527983 RepID=A0A517S9N7_9PLAN|nr:hypothetical protein [Caulifigura coniformis]QDT52834.1 hypothetical protein Pan44_08470 [Caulifigura coniformis]